MTLHVESSSPTRDRTHVPLIGRWMLDHWTTREVPGMDFVHCRDRYVATSQGVLLGSTGTYGAADPIIASFKASFKEWKHLPIHPAQGCRPPLRVTCTRCEDSGGQKGADPCPMEMTQEGPEPEMNHCSYDNGFKRQTPKKDASLGVSRRDAQSK